MEPSKSRIHAALEGRDPIYGRLFAFLIYGAILLAAITVTLQSLPAFSARHGLLLGIAEVVLLILFSLEYGLRLWSSPRPLRYALSFWGLIDLAAILPSLFFLLPDFQAIRILRLFRMFRLFKLFRIGNAVERLESAFASARDELLLFTFLAVLILFLSAVGIYHFEREAQPEEFGSIPQALWWATATLTTVGYGDVYPITSGGRIFTSLVLFVGLGVVAIPAGIITSALIAATKRDDDASD